MSSDRLPELDKPAARFTAAEVAAILRERGRLGAVPQEAEPALLAWLERAGWLLGPHAADREALAALLELIFHYDAREILRSVESHQVLARAGAREVIRELAREVLAGPEIDSDRLKQIVDAVKERTGYGGRELFHPFRLVIAGRAGEGELDRIVLLIDGAARLPFATPVKNSRDRMLEFCSTFD